MQSTKLPFICLIVLFTYQFVYSVDTNAVKYYPLRIGNYWVYSYYAYPCCGVYRFSNRVIDTLVTNGHKYFKVRTVYSNNYQPSEEFVRVDSTQGNIRVYVTSGSCPWLVNEKSRDSLSARLRDSSMHECSYYQQYFGYRCTDDSSYVTRCGLTKRIKRFGWGDYFETGGSRTFAQDIGFLSSSTYTPMNTTWVNLLGFIINGVACGDTSLTGIHLISSEIPSKFKLHQNYPNPFNSSSKIKMQILKLTDVKLVVFDALGREVAALVNEPLKPGTYEVEWDGTNYPSGVYFYKLETDDLILTKKMVLLK